MTEVLATRARRYAVECGGTAMLLAAIVGSGIMGERLAADNIAVALLANALATGAALVALILAFGPISGAHFNPLVSLAAASQGDLKWGDAGAYALVQLGGAVVGVGVADVMFGLPAYSWSEHVRTGLPQVTSEAVATFGLLVIIGCCRHRLAHAAVAVGAYITAAYWFTASTSFANPAVTLARACTDTFAGIRPTDVPPFLLGQAVGAVAAIACCRWLLQVSRDAVHHTTVAVRPQPTSVRSWKR
jgi:glycerol uptake facilitator-like aquaporin